MNKIKLFFALVLISIGSLSAAPANAFWQTLSAPVGQAFNGIFVLPLAHMLPLAAYSGARVTQVNVAAAGAGTISYCSNFVSCITFPATPLASISTFNAFGQPLAYCNEDMRVQVYGNLFVDSVSVTLVW